MKRNKLVGGYEVDFEILGIVCNSKEYKLAWHINDASGLSLKKNPDIAIDFADKTTLLISNCSHETDFCRVELIQNRLVGGSVKSQYVLPEAKQFDYIIKLKDESEDLNFENVISIIKDISIVEYAMRLNFEQLKSKENLLY